MISKDSTIPRPWGQYGRTFELGHKIAAPEEWKLTFNANSNLNLTVGLTVTNSDTLGTGVITEVNFDDNTDQSGYIIINQISGNNCCCSV